MAGFRKEREASRGVLGRADCSLLDANGLYRPGLLMQLVEHTVYSVLDLFAGTEQAVVNC